MSDTSRCYARSEMIRIRDLPKSRTRPIDLSEEFNNEDGLFSPDKWLQHRWQCEGVESRSNAGGGITRKKTSSRAEEVAAQDLETIVLSPQRRGFFSGCRALSPKAADETKARWRQNLNNGGGVDFKPFFQKRVEPARGRPGNNTSIWRNNTNDRSWNNDKSGRNNRNNNNFDSKNERLPEWVDEGPSSMTDIIELKGFDDDIREKKKRRRNRDSASKSGSQTANANHTLAASGDSCSSRQRNSHSNSTQGSRSSSRLAAAAGSLPPLNTTADVFGGAKDFQSSALEGVFAAGGETVGSQLTENAMTESGGICLPNSDAELAALLGILDIDPTKMQKDALGAAQVNQPSSSRFSRFFCKNSSCSVSEQRPLFNNLPSKSPRSTGAPRNGPSVLELAKSGGVFNQIGHNVSDNVPTALKELFSSIPPRPHTPVTPRDFKDGMTVEELERDFAKFHHPERPTMVVPPLMNPQFHHSISNCPPHPNDPNAAAKLAAMQAMAPQNDPFFLAFQQHMQRVASGSGAETSGGMGLSAGTKFPFEIRQPPQPQFDAARSPNVNGLPFMPTSVLRHMSEPPSSYGLNNTNMTVEQQQQLNMALMRGDLAAAQAMRSRPMFDNFDQPPTCKSPRLLGAPYGSSMFNRNIPDNVPAALKELFSAVPPRPQTPNTLRDFKESMTVEELERDHAKFHHIPPRSPMLALPLMNPPSFQNGPFTDAAAASVAKLAAMQAIAPPNEQFLAAFHQHMQQHFQRMTGNGSERTPNTESGSMPLPTTKFPFDGRQPSHDVRQPPQYDSRSPGGGSSPFMPTSVMRQLSVPPTGFTCDEFGEDGGEAGNLLN